MRRQAEGLKVERTIALVGLMGAGKTTVGRRLAHVLGLPFVDADAEIEAAAGSTIAEIFRDHGECEFRRGERQVIARLLAGPVHVLATGGGAFVDPRTRALMKERATTIWLKAPIEVLMKRVTKRDHRPLLKEDDPRAVLQRLLDERTPIYEQADLVVETGAGPHTLAVAAVLDALRAHLPVKHD
ncbi:MAG: shikimate kinase [Hyphomonadaceae bacterium]|nr:shikimate kinase [Hyphomonadaceae bacterium]